MKLTLADIVKISGGKVVGDSNLEITGISGIKEARPGDLTFLANPKYASAAKKTEASAILVGTDVLIEGKTVIQVEHPSKVFSEVINIFKESAPHPSGIHPTAVISKKATLGKNVSLGAFVVVEDGASIGDDTIIYAGCYVGYKAIIGQHCLIYSNVTIREDVQIGNHVIIHSSSVIGCDGYGYLTIDDEHMKIPQMGRVVIEDWVEIGSCVTIDRARFDKTWIGRGVKIDNLVQIAHNVHIGENTLVVAQVGIAGSTKIGRNVIVAGQVGVAGHLTVGDRSIIMAQSGVTKDVESGVTVFGCPAEEYRTYARMMSYVKSLSGYVDDIKSLRAEIETLKLQLNKIHETKNN